MNARRPPKEIKDLKPGEARRIEEYYDNFYRTEYTNALERDGRIMLDLYMKMTCVTMYDKMGYTEDEIYLFLGHHRELFHDQVKRVRSGEQVDYLNQRMREIFKRNGFPQGFFDKLLGKVETNAPEHKDSAPARNEWISLADRTPEKSGKYLVHTSKGIICTAVYNTDLGKWNGRLNKSATHWMRLPEPPKINSNIG